MHLERQILDLLEAHPIIPAVRDDYALATAIASSVGGIFLLNATLTNLKERIQRIKQARKLAFVHLEMVAGLSKDQAALEFLKAEIAPDGVITTKPNLIQPARHLGMLTIQRLFILDSLSFRTGLKMVQNNSPDFIEVMPGIIPKVILELKSNCSIPIIAGGMVNTKEEIIELLKVEAAAVSTSRAELWEM